MRGTRGSAVAVFVLHGVVFAGGAVVALFLTFIAWAMGAEGVTYCSPPDHSGPCTRFQENTTLGHWAAACSVLMLAAATVLQVVNVRSVRGVGDGVWNIRLGAVVRGAVSLLLVAVVCGVSVYGMSDAG